MDIANLYLNKDLLTEKVLTENMGLFYNVKNILVILWMALAIGFTWIGFFAAVKMDEIYASATSGLRSFGQNVAKVAAKAPFTLPIIPGIAGGKAQSILQVTQKPQQMVNAMADGRITSEEIGKIMRGEVRTPTSNARNTDALKRDISNNVELKNDVKLKIESINSNAGSLNSAQAEKQVRNALEEHFPNLPLNSKTEIQNALRELETLNINTADIANKIGT